MNQWQYLDFEWGGVMVEQSPLESDEISIISYGRGVADSGL